MRANELRLKIEGNEIICNSVPIDVLSSAFRSIQRTIFLLAMEKENYDIKARDRVSQDLSNRYSIFCTGMGSGSFSVSLAVGNSSNSLFRVEETSSIVEQFREVLSLFSLGHFKELYEYIKDSARRKRVLEALKEFSPVVGSDTKISIYFPSNVQEAIVLSGEVTSKAKEYINRLEENNASEIVTGQLIRIDFQEKKITILYPINNRELDCFYEESLEDTLLENRRQLIQVTGIVSLDENDYPKKIVSVSSIEEVDLSPVYISEARYNHVRIFLNSPLELFPELTDDKQYMVIDREELGINVIAKSRKELLDELNEIIYVIWKEYVDEKEEVLVLQALEYKKNWDNRIKTVDKIG